MTNLLEGIYLVTHVTGGGDGHGNHGFIAMFVASRFASGAKYLVYCRVFTVM